MAATNARGIKNKSPQTKLAVAFPLVTAGALGVSGMSLLAIDAAGATALPQTRQNLSSAATLLPHAAQSDAISASCQNCTKHYTALCTASMLGRRVRFAGR